MQGSENDRQWVVMVVFGDVLVRVRLFFTGIHDDGHCVVPELTVEFVVQWTRGERRIGYQIWINSAHKSKSSNPQTDQHKKPTSTMRISCHAVRVAAAQFGHHLAVENSTRRTYDRYFRSEFGVPLIVAVRLWNRVDRDVAELDCSYAVYYLATLVFLRSYPTVDRLANAIGRDEKTVRFWVWKFADYFSRLELVRVDIIISCLCFGVLSNNSQVKATGPIACSSNETRNCHTPTLRISLWLGRR